MSSANQKTEENFSSKLFNENISSNLKIKIPKLIRNEIVLEPGPISVRIHSSLLILWNDDRDLSIIRIIKLSF